MMMMIIIMILMMNNIFISLRGGGHYLPCGFWSSSFPSCHFKVSCVTPSALRPRCLLTQEAGERTTLSSPPVSLFLFGKPTWRCISTPWWFIAPPFSENVDIVDLILLHPLPRRFWHFYHHALLSVLLVPHQGAAHNPPTVLEWTL